MKLALVGLNLGGPDTPEAVRPFLFNLFNDAAILRVPGAVRPALAWLIARLRAPTAAKIYDELGGGSPLLPNTRAQMDALQAEIARRLPGDEVRVFIAMRYWHPMSAATAAEVKAWAPDRIMLVSLYPQFSTTTTASSLNAWEQAARRAGLEAPTQALCCYPGEQGFIAAWAQRIATSWASLMDELKGRDTPPPRLLFSAHGLPERIVAAGDPYQWQCEQTAAAILDRLAREHGLTGLDWVSSYQSRVGPLTWIGPDTEDEVKRAGAEGVPLVIAPIAFVSEHSETLVEIGIEYRDLALESGVPAFARVPTIDAEPPFIEGLAGSIMAALASGRALCSQQGGRLCPQGLAGCPQKADPGVDQEVGVSALPAA